MKTETFGKLENQEISLFTLKNENGMTVKLTNYGATITSITIPNMEKGEQSIACGFDSLEDYFSEEYKANAPYFGCTVGRYSSQIKDAKFTLAGKEYTLAANCGSNNLHGGTKGFDKQIWDFNEIENGIQFFRLSEDMEEGYPGNLKVSVSFQLTDENEIIINYNAVSDKDTPISLTNHSYFNLSAFAENIENHKVKVFTEKLLELDETGAATGNIKDVSATAEDLRQGKIVKDVHEAMGDGFEHFWVFENSESKLNKTAEVSFGNKTLEVFSTEPCMLFYTGKYTSDALQRNKDEKYGKYRAFACETHRYPNGPNIENSPASITKAGEEYKSTTIFKLNF